MGALTRLPLKPPGVDLDSNMREASVRWNPFWFYRQVRWGGPWDLKHLGPQWLYDDFGNFHYGAVGTAFGFPAWMLFRGAGWCQRHMGHSRPGWGKPWWRKPYGDDPWDQNMIRAGIAYAGLQRHWPGYQDRMVWRTVDILVAVGGLLLFSPVILACAVATLCDSGRPIFNGTCRLGRYGRTFRCWKIRTLHQGHDEILRRHLAENQEARAEWETHAKLRVDPRVTRIGRRMRQWSLDEAPQFWNLLMGDMALFGPRAFAVHERDRLGRWEADILSVTPGFVSFYGAYGRSRLTVEHRVRFDAKFARKMHIARVRWGALARTVFHCLLRNGAQ